METGGGRKGRAEAGLRERESEGRRRKAGVEKEVAGGKGEREVKEGGGRGRRGRDALV